MTFSLLIHDWRPSWIYITFLWFMKWVGKWPFCRDICFPFCRGTFKGEAIEWFLLGENLHIVGERIPKLISWVLFFVKSVRQEESIRWFLLGENPQKRMFDLCEGDLAGFSSEISCSFVQADKNNNSTCENYIWGCGNLWGECGIEFCWTWMLDDVSW